VRRQLEYLAVALPTIAGAANARDAQDEFLKLLDVSEAAGHQAFDRILVESAYTGTVAAAPPPRWLG
jgi:hypothetical protein